MLDFTKMRWKIRDCVNLGKLFLDYPDLEQLYYEVKAFFPQHESLGNFLAGFEGEEEAGEESKAVPPSRGSGGAGKQTFADIAHPHLSEQEVMALVVYAYHLQSPLVFETSMHRRRASALELLGYPIKTSDDLEKYKHLAPYIAGANSFVNRVALQLCKFEKNFKWMELCRKSDMLDDVFLTLKEEMSGTDKKSANEILKIKLDIEAKAEALQTRINQLATEIFMGDTSLIDYAASQIILEQRKPLISPERIAKATRTKKRAAAT